MSKISNEDVADLEKQYTESANSLGTFLINNFATLTPDQRNSLRNQGIALINQVQELETHAVGVILDDTQASLNQIKQATKDANQAIKTVNSFKNAITIATSLVTLSASIYAGNIGGIASALQGLLEAVKDS